MRNKEIWKFPLEIVGNQTIQIPFDADIFAVQCQYEKPCIWAIVQPENSTNGRMIEILGTGQSIPEQIGMKRIYLGTIQLKNGTLVFHVFECEGI